MAFDQDTIADIVGVLAGVCELADVKVYDHEPDILAVLPCVTIDGPSFDRVEPLGLDLQLSTFDTNLVFTLRLYESEEDPETSTRQVRKLLGRILNVFDTQTAYYQTPPIDDARVQSGELQHWTRNDKKLIGYECELAVFALTSTS